MKQSAVALSSTESEYISLSEAAREGMHYIYMLKQFGIDITPILIRGDNIGALEIATNTVNNKRTKHIDIRFHHVRDHVQKGHIRLTYIDTANNPADLLTKPLGLEKTRLFTNWILRNKHSHSD